jgi:hypothetical protein
MAGFIQDQERILLNNPTHKTDLKKNDFYPKALFVSPPTQHEIEHLGVPQITEGTMNLIKALAPTTLPSKLSKSTFKRTVVKEGLYPNNKEDRA